MGKLLFKYFKVKNTKIVLTNCNVQYLSFSCNHFFSAEAADKLIKPDQTYILSTEGSKIILSCTYDDSATYLYWYQQKTQSAPEFLLLIYKVTEDVTKADHPHPGLSIKLLKSERKVVLELDSASVSDSSLYYCAMKPTVTGNPTTLYKNSFI